MLGVVQPEHEIRGKAREIALHLLVEALRRHPVQSGEVSVDHDLVAADEENLPGDTRADNECYRFSFPCDDALPLAVRPELSDHHPENL